MIDNWPEASLQGEQKLDLYNPKFCRQSQQALKDLQENDDLVYPPWHTCQGRGEVLLFLETILA